MPWNWKKFWPGFCCVALLQSGNFRCKSSKFSNDIVSISIGYQPFFKTIWRRCAEILRLKILFVKKNWVRECFADWVKVSLTNLSSKRSEFHFISWISAILQTLIWNGSSAHRHARAFIAICFRMKSLHWIEWLGPSFRSGFTPGIFLCQNICKELSISYKG